ncbi:sodium:solute symporter family protein [Clostridium luticellarii]|jgi:SSS family solute:Na+ symporter|uniref:Putative symporter YodF n=1 Tax=Clostridium luticellarii TaxID=1691940 RepID=A0A2T0BSN3_9CLOT|nr:sodium:solute symporter family protein [Clostridium luticellarii]MCI1945644.1 sodium:solute symporter family protein [Clostridium luticellarii]MCI1968461.1 sodium:solute symporter family protein [Clostridium luticellarii]MCI1996522.1 sodium:solute symporter family protein [Clostridium luticellarii]MCI2039855.1 sodium:solute symporter family protein [Clostridium luticellarii]PRR86852.1 putative symporter YodF [Clostridium luticellarii]
MGNTVQVLAIIFIFIIATVIIGIIPGTREKLDLEGWAVGGRSFGRFLNWFVLAGEIYTSFAFLGASGWAYTKGGPTFYILAYSGLAFLISYYILPAISREGQKHKFLSQADFISYKYNSKSLGILVAIIGIIFVLPYLQLQITALGIIIQAASSGVVGRVTAMVIAFILVAAFVYISGLKGVASTAVIKDIIMAVAMVVFGIYIPVHYFGSISGMFHSLNSANPGFLTLPGGTKTMGVSWFMTTVLLTSMGFYMWPHIFADSFSAKDPKVLKHNAVFLPLYSLCLIFPMLVGFAAFMVIPGLKTGDMAFISLSLKTFPGWAVGIIGGAGALASMVPAADLLLASSVLISHNIYGATIGKNADSQFINRLSKSVVIVLTFISLIMAIFMPNMLVNLLLTGYSGVTQFFPIVVLSLFWKKGVTKQGAFAGIIVGEFLVFYLMLNKMDPFHGWNAGFVALVANTVVLLIVSLLTNKNKTALVQAGD